MKLWKKAVLVISTSLVSLYIAFMVGYFATSEPSLCESCHQIAPYKNSWQQSTHKDVKCLYCHEKRGFVGKLDSKLRGLNYVYQHMTGQHTIIAAGKIFEQNCIACHLGDYYNYPNVVRMDSAHYEFIKKNRSCLDCHRDIGHKINIFSKEKFM